MLKLKLLFASLVCYPTFMAGQTLHSWQLETFTGQFLSHRQQRHASEIPHYGVSLDFIKKTTGRKYWQYAHNYPNMGLSATWRTLGNDKIYGQVISILPYLEFSLMRSRVGAFQLKHGTGLAIATRPHDPVTNPENVLLSTTLNATSMVDAGYRFFLTRNWDIKLGGMIYHYSNGGFKLPNAGINAGSFYVGGAWHPDGNTPVTTEWETVRNFRKVRFRLATAMGMYGYKGGENPELEFNPQVSGLVFLQHSTAFRTGLGLEVGRLNRAKIQPAIYVEEEIQFGKIATRYGFGGYLKNKNVGLESFYSKIGMAYYPRTENHIPGGFFIGSMLKAHGTKAAHIEILMGYVL